MVNKVGPSTDYMEHILNIIDLLKKFEVILFKPYEIPKNSRINSANLEPSYC